MAAKQYRLEDDLLKKSRPKRNSKRYKRLEAALHAQLMDRYAKGEKVGFNQCERCGAMLINPQSILIHQGGHCQKKIMQNTTWISVTEKLPPEGQVVNTKVDDEKTVRNECELKRMGMLWFFPDGSMYVYYDVTHWHPINSPNEQHKL